MRDVWKFPLSVDVLSASFTNVLHIPAGAKLLHVREQGMDVALWFEVDTMAHQEERKFQLFGTGTGPIRDGLEYVGTGIFAEGSLVLHVYEVKEEA
jgi:hypothetical protein